MKEQVNISSIHTGTGHARTWTVRQSRWIFNRLHWVVIYGYAFLYMYTGYDKLMHLGAFVKGNRRIPLVGQYAELIGWGIPIIEILLAVLLVVPYRKSLRPALWGATLLMGIFTLYLALMLLFVEHRLCHCGGVIEAMGWRTHLVFDLVWFGVGLWAIRKLK